MSLPRAALLGCMLSLAVSLTVPAPARAEVTLLIPSRTFIDVPAEKKGTEPQAAKAPAAKEAKNNADSGKDAPAEAAGEENKAQAAAQPAPPPLNAEVDMLISLMRPREHAAQPMDMPQLFAVLRHDAGTRFVNGTPQPERRDLLGDMEESLYLDTKAWGANVAIDQPGLYQFITETARASMRNGNASSSSTSRASCRSAAWKKAGSGRRTAPGDPAPDPAFRPDRRQQLYGQGTGS